MYEYEYRPLLLLLFIEITLFLLLWALFFIRRFINSFQDIKAEKRHKTNAAFVIKCLKNVEHIDISNAPKTFKHARELLWDLEEFNKRFRDQDWNVVKIAIAKEFLLPKARKVVKSFLTRRRVFAARCFALVPLEEDQERMISLIADYTMLVQSNVAMALIALESPSGIQKIIEYMSVFRNFAYYIFLDALQNGSQRVMEIVSQIAAIKELHRICLSILATRSLGFPFPGLEGDLASQDVQTRLLAIRLLGNNPNTKAGEVLLAFSKDPQEKIRREAISALSSIGGEASIARLKEILFAEGPIKVRLDACFGLHKLGALEVDQSSGDAAKIINYVRDFG